jgi:hypothetical protein
MLTRFTSWIAIAIGGAFLVVAQASFAASTTMWLMFGISAGTLIVSLGLVVGYRKHLPTVATAGVAAVLSGWMIVSSLVFPLSTVVNLALAGALGLVGLALIGLTINELAREHVVHTLETTTIATDAAGEGRHALVG